MISCKTSNSPVDCHVAWRLIHDIDRYYPDVEEWFWLTVVPGVVAGRDVMVLAWDGDQAVGLALGRGGADAKLRCIRVKPECSGRGVGVRLVDRMLSELGCDRPLVTVPEEMMHGLARIFVNRFEFRLTAVEKGIYRPGKLEYVFNGPGQHATAR